LPHSEARKTSRTSPTRSLRVPPQHIPCAFLPTHAEPEFLLLTHRLQHRRLRSEPHAGAACLTSLHSKCSPRRKHARCKNQASGKPNHVRHVSFSRRNTWVLPGFQHGAHPSLPVLCVDQAVVACASRWHAPPSVRSPPAPQCAAVRPPLGVPSHNPHSD
jgi:hypothetical protein